MRLRNAKGEPISRGNYLPGGLKVLGFKQPSIAKPYGTILLENSKGDMFNHKPASYGLHWISIKPTKTEQLVPTWAGVVLVYAETYTLPTSQVELLRMARLADHWVAFSKRYPHLAKQPH